MKIFKTYMTYTLLVIISALAALNYKILVFPNSFAPSGVDGICTMIQYITKTNMGYLALCVNIPLLILGYLFVDKSFIRKTAVYTISFSAFIVLLGNVDLSAFLYHTDIGTSIVLAPFAAGVIRGILYAITLKIGGSGGGIDIIAAIVNRYKPHYSLISIIFTMNVAIALEAYFVYGFKVEPVICSIIYSYMVSMVSKSIESAAKENVRFEIITEDADKLCDRISQQLGITSTVVEAKGGYSGAGTSMVICATNKETAPKLHTIVSEFNNAITFESTIVASKKLGKY